MQIQATGTLAQQNQLLSSNVSINARQSAASQGGVADTKSGSLSNTSTDDVKNLVYNSDSDEDDSVLAISGYSLPVVEDWKKSSKDGDLPDTEVKGQSSDDQEIVNEIINLIKEAESGDETSKNSLVEKYNALYSASGTASGNILDCFA